MILTTYSNMIGLVTIPTLATILIYATVKSLKPNELATILRTKPTSQITIVTTFYTTLFLPISTTIGIEISLSLLLQLNQKTINLKVVQLIPINNKRWTKHPTPSHLPNHQTTILNIYNNLLYANSRTLQIKLPNTTGTKKPTVILRLHGRTTINTTFIKIMDDYTITLTTINDRLYLNKIDPTLTKLLHHTNQLNKPNPINIFKTTKLIKKSTKQTLHKTKS